MSATTADHTHGGSGSGDDDLNLKDTELTLGLPGAKSGTKRGFSETVDLYLAGKIQNEEGASSSHSQAGSNNSSCAPKPK